MGPQDQPDFVNAAAALETRLAPRALMQALLDTERRRGRVRGGTRWGPRSLDLDLLLYDELVLHEPGLDLPHPGMHERAFVLYPLADIAPNQSVPGLGTVAELRARCRDTRIRRLEVENRE